MSLHRSIAFAGIVAAPLLAGCAVGTDYSRPAVALPAMFPAAAPAADAGAAAALRADWWTLYGDPKLNELVAGALERNADIRLAVARIEEADAYLREANASFLPEIDFSTTGTSRSRISQTTATPLPASIPPVRNNVRLSLITAFELDFWGKLRRGVESVRAQNLSTRYAKEVVTLSLAGLTSQAYFSLRSLDAQIAVTRESLASREDTLGMVRARARGGVASDLEINQALLARADAAVQLGELRRQRALIEHQLAALTGRLDLSLASGDLRTLPVPPVPPAGLPSTLLERRPDVRQAEQDLIANNARIGVARAAMLPTISLTGSFGGESTSLAAVLNNDAGRIWSIGFGLLQPIFDAGRLAARTEQAEARQRQALASYQKAVEAAFREVADALTNLSEYGALESQQKERVDAARNSLRLARLRYEAGYSGFLEVLDAQRSANDAEQAFLRNRQAYLSASVDFMRSLGGGWTGGSVAAAP
jgi:multidrug efflux system outer membrane protein